MKHIKSEDLALFEYLFVLMVYCISDLVRDHQPYDEDFIGIQVLIYEIGFESDDIVEVMERIGKMSGEKFMARQFELLSQFSTNS